MSALNALEFGNSWLPDYYDDGGIIGNGYMGPSGGSGSQPNPFIPTFGSGGQAQGWGGMGPAAQWGGGGMRRRLPMGNVGGGGRMAFNGGGAQQMGGPPQQMGGGGGPQGSPYGWGGGPGGMLRWAQSQPAPQGNGIRAGDPASGWTPKSSQELLNWITDRGMQGGAYGMNPPPEIMAGIRGQAVQDAGARDRSARLGLQSRGDTDASTYGFQALMSQLGGQDQTSRQLGAADLGMRQQQLQFLQNILGQYSNANVGLEGQNRQSRAAWEAGGGGSGWGQAGNMLGRGAAAYFGGG